MMHHRSARLFSLFSVATTILLPILAWPLTGRAVAAEPPEIPWWVAQLGSSMVLSDNFPLAIPPFIGTGEIRFVAPAAALSPPAQALLGEGVKLLSERNYRVSVDNAVHLKHYYFAGDADQRQQSFAAAVLAPEVSAVWAARGGYGTAAALGSIDSSTLAQHPKWLIGFSDVTAAHILWQQTGLVSLHAVMGTGLSTWTQSAHDELFSILQEPEACRQRFSAEVLWRPLERQTVSGTVWGGNLTVLASLVGRTQLPPIARRSTVLFIEDTELSYRSHRDLDQLLTSGSLDNVEAVLMGQWRMDDLPQSDEILARQREARAMMVELLREHNIAVLGDLPVGHAPSSRPLLLGARATVNLDSGEIVVDMDETPRPLP
jgi:muramoyltetrapeptide carboxypeptidase